jgi:hypothetical protein
MIMSHNSRAEWFLTKANLNPPLHLTHLAIPVNQDFLPFDSPNRDIAHNLLVQARVCAPDYKPPETQIWHHIRTKSQKAAVCDVSNWTFTKHEVAKAFDLLLEQPTLPPAGVAQALLKQASLSSLDELWMHLHDEFLERKMKNKRLTSESIKFDAIGMTWLDKVVSINSFNYIHLMCQTKVSQAVLDRALGIALSKASLQAMKLLLSFGANASSYLETIDLHVQSRNLESVELLLSASGSVDIQTWKECLGREIARAEAGESLWISFFLLLLSNCPQIVSASLLLSTLQLKNLQASAIVMAYASSNEVFVDVRQRACEVVSRYQNDYDRLAFFTLFLEADMIEDSMILREELLKGVKARYIPLVHLIVQAGVAVDAPPHTSLQWAISQLDFELMESLRRGNMLCSPTQLLTFLPESTTVQNMIHVRAIFGLRSTDDYELGLEVEACSD